jgi:hypothetical protein
MAERHEILYSDKLGRASAHEQITHIGGRNGDGTTWKITQQEAISGITTGRWSFYVKREGNELEVIAAKSRLGHRFLKTERDGDQANTLLGLPACR